MDEDQVMSLFVEDAGIQPNSLEPIEGKEKIRSFWFPDDGSKTKINLFETEILNFEYLDSLAITIHSSHLDWSFQKDTVQFSMVQKGINTTIYRKQENNSWKIWRSMWTDISSKRK